MHELIQLDATDVAAAIRRGDASATDVVRACLERIAEVEPAINAFITVAGDRALAEARDRDRAHAAGESLGPLHGVPVGVKDNVDTHGMPSTAGSAILRDHVPSADSTVVARLRAAGAVIIGKTNLHEFAWGGTTENPHYGPTRNPWDTRRFAAGSSGGSGAALAAREAPLAIGTDTGGSIRLPAAVCGTVGLRPTVGRVSNHGSVPCAWSMDTIGPMARTVRDCALALEVIAGPDGLDGQCPDVPVGRYVDVLDDGVDTTTIGIPTAFALDGIQVGVRACVTGALEELGKSGADIADVRIDGLDHVRSPWLTVHMCEPSAYHAEWLRTRASEYGDDVRANLEAGELIRATDYLQAQRFRTLFRAQLLAVLQDVDVLAMPTLPFTATPLFEASVELEPGTPEDMLTHLPRFTALASAAGLPAISVPCGFDERGLPVGMMLVGRPFDEATLFRIAAAYERRAPWHARAPQLS